MHITNLNQWKRIVAIEVTRHDFLKTRLISGGAFLALAGLFLILAANNTFSLSPAFPRQYSILSRWIGGTFTTIGIFTFHFGIMKQRVEKRPKNLAELPLSYDPTKAVPKEKYIREGFTALICTYLDPRSLGNISRMNREWNSSSKNERLWQDRAYKMFSRPVANMLYQSRNSWRKVFHDLNTPIKAKSALLCSDIVDKDLSRDKQFQKEFQETLNSKHGADINELRKALKHLIKCNKAHFLNMRIVHTPLEYMARKGSEKNVKALVAYGAKDPLYLEGSRSNKVRNSALFEAASYGHSKIVKLLLEHGSQVDLVRCDDDQSMHCFVFLARRVGVNFSDARCKEVERIAQSNNSWKPTIYEGFGYRPGKKQELIECFILLVNAWKGQKGSEHVANDMNAKRALTEAVMACHTELADLLIALGIKLEISEDEIVKSIANGIKNDDVPGLQWICNHFTVDFRMWRDNEWNTWLHFAASQDSQQALQFLKQFIPEGSFNRYNQTYHYVSRSFQQRQAQQREFWDTMETALN